MGNHKNITYEKFPDQCKSLVGKKVKVCFHYDTSKTILGEIVRCDREEPWVEIIKLENGNYVLTTECQFSEA